MDKNIFEKLPALKLDQDGILELKEIYQEEYGKTLSDTEALEMGQRLLRLFQIIYRPLPGDSHGSSGQIFGLGVDSRLDSHMMES